MTLRPTVRLKLTLLYGGLFLVAGAVLLGVNYALVSRGLHDQSGPGDTRIGVVMRATEPFQLPVRAGPERPDRAGDAGGGPETLVTPDGRPLEDVLEEYQAGVRNDALHALLVQSSVALGVMAVAAVGLGWLVAGRALRPLQQVTAAARRLSEANLHERLALEGPKDELKELADTFDAMLERLEKAFESQRRFVANASHELRTPLTIQRTLVEVTLADPDADERTLREMAVSLEAAIARSQRLLDSLLLLARSEQRLTKMEPLDLADAAALAVEQVAGEAEAAGLSVASDLRPAPTAGNRALLERLVANLAENAVRHNRDEGWVRIETDARDGMATVRVVNSGPVIPPLDVPGLFEPFRRGAQGPSGPTERGAQGPSGPTERGAQGPSGPTERGAQGPSGPTERGAQGSERATAAKGTGLGLSVVRAVTVAHGGHVGAVGRESGGLEVTVSLPAPVRRRATGEQSIPWPAVSAAPIAPRPASVASGGAAASPTSMPAASASPTPTSSSASAPL